jgi:hypothetical protein
MLNKYILVYIWTSFVITFLRQYSMFRTQTALEDELGMSKPTVFQRDIITILLNHDAVSLG